MNEPTERHGVSALIAALLAITALAIGLASGLALGGAGGFVLGQRLAQAKEQASPSLATNPAAPSQPAAPSGGAPGSGRPAPRLMPLMPGADDFAPFLEQLPPELRDRFRELIEPSADGPDA